MLLNLAPTPYLENHLAMPSAEERLETDLTVLADLHALGVRYIYIGARGDFAGLGLNLAGLSEVPGVNVLYQQDGVSILGIH